MTCGYRSAWFFTLIPNPTLKPAQTMFKKPDSALKMNYKILFTTSPNHVEKKQPGKLRPGVESRRKARIPWGEFKIEVIYFPRGAPRGDTQGGPQGGCPWGGSGELFGLPIRRINPRIRPQGYFFMLRSILPLPDLKILLKIQKITKN